jgi:hypothetical protein
VVISEANKSSFQFESMSLYVTPLLGHDNIFTALGLSLMSGVYIVAAVQHKLFSD